MLIFKKSNFFSKNKVIILQIFIILLITSCNLNILPKNHNLIYNKNDHNQFKKIIIPKSIKSLNENPEYKIPYTEQDLKTENIDIFPPI